MQLDTTANFSLSANGVGGEGRGEVARLNLNPLAPALSPLGRGEGVGGSAKLHPNNIPDCGLTLKSPLLD